MRRIRCGAVAIFGTVALSVPGALLGQQRGGVPPQRGSPPGQDTPYILVTAFRAPSKQLAVEGADELRDRLKSEHSAKELFVITKTSVEGTLTASGYPTDSALNVSDLMELAKTMRGEYVMDVTLKSAGGKAVRVEPRVLMRMGQQTVAQPLPAIDGKDVGDAAKQIEKSISEALKQIPMYKECRSGFLAGKFDDAAAKARAGIAAYPNAAWSRICLLSAYASGKSAPTDSVIAVANAILATDSTSMLALANLADAYIAKADTAKAVDMMLRAYTIEPNKKTLDNILVIIAKFAPEKGIPIVKNIIEREPGDADLVRNLWILEGRASRFKDMLATGEALIKIDTAAATADFYNRMIGAAQSDSNSTKVQELAGKAAQKFPKDASFLRLLAAGYRTAGQLPQSLEAARKATELEPKDPRGWLLAIYAAKDMNQTDTLLVLSKGALAAGVEKTQIEPVLLQLVRPVMAKADSSKERADWDAMLSFVQKLDATLPLPAFKFYTGLAEYQIGVDAAQNVNKLAGLTGKAATEAKPKACTETKLAEDMLTNATIAMTSGGGGAYAKENAVAVMNAIQQYNEYIPRWKTAFCGK
ncbi:MAG TPA: hypothetical protein VIP11_14935 [Gemmatimonadaceae bacterium]